MYKLITPTRNETWGAYPMMNPYARLAGRPISGAGVPTRLTDIPRGYTLIVNGTTVTEVQTPYQDDLENADYYFLGGHNYDITDQQAAVLIAAGYSEWVTPIP
jgi:hypothetical protein